MSAGSRAVRWGAGAIVALLALALLVVAAFPVSWLKDAAERRLSDRFGRPVSIGAIERAPAFSFTPTIRVRDVRVPQADWAGAGDLARIAEASVRVNALALVVGRFSPSGIAARGVRLELVRDASGRENWRKADDRDAAGGRSPRLEDFRVTDAVVRYRDAVQDRAVTLRVAADARRGVRASGSGSVRGRPVRVSASGPAIAGYAGAWPFAATIDGIALTMRVTGTMDTPLDTDRMTLRVTARASDLKMIDAVIEAGLFGTRPVRLAADVRHEDDLWRVTGLAGTIGTSDIAGEVTVTKVGGRTKLDGSVRSRRLDFEDFADDAGTAAAVALERRQGLRIVPDTRINIARIDTTDGRIAFAVDRIVSRRRPSSLTSARGVLSIDRQRLLAEPLRLGLARGAITGRVVVDQRGGKPKPTVTLALDLAGSSIGAVADGGNVNGRLDGRVRLTGVGDTIRQAVGASTGTIGLVARDGALPAKLAALLGFDAGRALTADANGRAGLRCAVVRLAVTDGRGTLAPLIVDTTQGQTRGTGTVTFPAETIAATLTGAPKRDSVLRLPGSVVASGTIRDPKVTVPREVGSVGNVLKGIGRAITGRQGSLATDADCAALGRQAIGR